MTESSTGLSTESSTGTSRESSTESLGGSSTGSPHQRNLMRTLASIVLGVETVIVFLASLVMGGLGAVPPTVALVGGVTLCLALVVTVSFLRYRWAYTIGWILQGVLVFMGFLNPAMLLVGAVFAGLWTYSMVRGTRIDRRAEAIQTTAPTTLT
jgi:hypothetical protein